MGTRPALALTLVAAILLVQAGAAYAQASATPTPQSHFDRLVLAVAPPTLLADGQEQEVLFVALVDKGGALLPAPVDLPVRVETSDPQVVRLAADLHVPQGTAQTRGKLAVGSIPGTATVIASAPGYGTALAQVTTVGVLGATAPLGVRIATAPQVAFGDSPRSIPLGVTLVGANQQPAPHTRAVTVRLISSNPQVLRVSDTVTVPAGQAATVAEGTIVGRGAAVVTAVAAGYMGGSVAVSVQSAGEPAATLKAYPLFDPLVPGAPQPALVVVATDSKGLPALLPCVGLLASSSAEHVVRVLAQPGDCQQPALLATLGLQAGPQAGEATVTIATDGAAPATVKVRSVARRPSRGVAWLAPGSLPEAYGVVQLQDADGQAVAADEVTPVELTIRANGEPVVIGQAILPGQSFVAVPLPPLPPGPLTLRASMAGVGEHLLTTTISPGSEAAPPPPSAVPVPSVQVGSIQVPVHYLLIAGGVLLVASLLWNMLFARTGEAAPSDTLH